MLATKKGDGQLNEDLSGPSFSVKNRLISVRGKKITFTTHQPQPAPASPHEKLEGNWSANSENRGDGSSNEKKVGKNIQRKPNTVVANTGTRGRGLRQTTKTSNAGNNLNKYRFQIRKFFQGIEEYKKLEGYLRTTYSTLINMRKEILNTADVDPGEVPTVNSSIQDLIQSMMGDVTVEGQSRLMEVEKECIDVKEACTVMEQEKQKLQETLDQMNLELKSKEEELIKVKENQKLVKDCNHSVMGDGDTEELENLRKNITVLDQENSDLMEKLKRFDDDKSETSRDNQKVKSLEKLIENLHIDVKKLKDQLKVEKEIKSKLNSENEKLNNEIKELKTLGSSCENKFIILEKDNKIQDLQKRLNEISRIRPHQTSGNQEVFKVDFSADTPSLINQLAKFVQLYEELSREGFDLESKLKEAHVEIYRLEQILEKQLVKLKEQDDCLKNMEDSLSKVVIESRKNSRIEQGPASQTGKCKCQEFQVLIKEKEEFSEKLKEKMSLLYQKYKQYKSECNLMRKKLDAFEKRNWLKKLVNL